MDLFNRIKKVYLLTTIFHTTIIVAATAVSFFLIRYLGGSEIMGFAGAYIACIGGKLLGADDTVQNYVLAVEDVE